jgi:hypothetical protein
MERIPNFTTTSEKEPNPEKVFQIETTSAVSALNLEEDTIKQTVLALLQKEAEKTARSKKTIPKLVGEILVSAPEGTTLFYSMQDQWSDGSIKREVRDRLSLSQKQSGHHFGTFTLHIYPNKLILDYIPFQE